MSEDWDNVRPGWTAVRKFNDRLDVKRRLRGQPASGRGGNLRYATVGELVDPGGTGERVEVVLWLLKQNSSTRGGHELWSSGVVLTFPRTLPLFGFYPKSNYWKATPADFRSPPRDVLRHSLREYPALAALGPGHEATRVLVTDDWVFSALVRPEVLGRPQLSGRHLRLDGNTAVAWAKGQTAPKMLEELAIELYDLANLLPRI
ncbi:hypothetical protein [Streptomyces sp. WZ-12]|uniref:hypothetical protein n=1 Tax=Streptomyces sp. WZ-12 TaxID=3030210 RepID=UPI0023814ABF|nr:hypothetical protein [Streptomyces sp. WZ-12]